MNGKRKVNSQIINVKCVCVVHCLSFRESWMLGSNVALYAEGRFKSHGTAGAFVEHITMCLLDVRLH